jgi:hypothetical protein
MACSWSPDGRLDYPTPALLEDVVGILDGDQSSTVWSVGDENDLPWTDAQTLFER